MGARQLWFQLSAQAHIRIAHLVRCDRAGTKTELFRRAMAHLAEANSTDDQRLQTTIVLAVEDAWLRSAGRTDSSQWEDAMVLTVTEEVYAGWEELMNGLNIQSLDRVLDRALRCYQEK